jgi:CubicO group peptidase (beta-lactamase class C family)
MASAEPNIAMHHIGEETQGVLSLHHHSNAMRTSNFLVSALALSGSGLATLQCRPEGPVFPPPLNLAASKIFTSTAANLTTTLDRAASGNITAGWQVGNVSFSLGLISLGQTDPGVPLWEYHHLGSKNTNGTKSISRNSEYLMGSLSKVVSTAATLLSGLDLDDPITKYLPQLNTTSSLIKWNEVTLRSIVSQQAGIPPNYGFSDFYFLKSYFETLGFPHVDDTAYPPCGVIGLNKGCTKDRS